MFVPGFKGRMWRASNAAHVEVESVENVSNSGEDTAVSVLNIIETIW